MSKYYKEAIDILESLDGMYREILVELAKNYPKAFCDAYHAVTQVEHHIDTPTLSKVDKELLDKHPPKHFNAKGTLTMNMESGAKNFATLVKGKPSGVYEGTMEEGGLNLPLGWGHLPTAVIDTAKNILWAPGIDSKVVVSVLQMIYGHPDMFEEPIGQLDLLNAADKINVVATTLQFFSAYTTDSALFDNWIPPDSIDTPSKVHAIKRVREVTGWGLKEAKELTEWLIVAIDRVVDMWETEYGS